MKLEGDEFSSELMNFKLDGKQVAFDEKLKFRDLELVIQYTGEVNGDEIKFTRKVGDIATENFVAQRKK